MSLLVPQRKILGYGRYSGKIIRAGEVIDEWIDDPNLVVNQGLDSLLNVYFMGATQISSWYVGCYEGNYTPVAGDTAATFPASSTETTAYVASTRPGYTGVTSTAELMTNAASPASFTFNATKTIYGAFLTSLNTKSGTTGTLFSAAKFGSSKSVTSGDQLLLTYSFSAASA